jgi:GNAT superfamily N-acetyltransferase
MAGAGREHRAALSAYRCVSDAVEAGGAVVLAVPEAPDSPMLNRVVALGVERPATEDDVDAALATLAPGVTFYVAVAPAARPPELAGWLRDRGLEPGWGWMAFRRGVEPLPAPPTELRLVEVGDDEQAAAFAGVVRTAYGLPEALEPRLTSAWRVGWQCWLALAGAEPAGAAGLFVEDGVGYLGLAGTAPSHRGRGAQSALLAARIARAAQLGCDLVLTETGERGPGRASGSYRNILRAGFQEVAVTANWGGRH